MEDENVFQHKKEERWINKQRTLVVASRGITDRQRHLMLDLVNMMPHCKKEIKIEKKDIQNQIQELCYIHSCCNFLYFESRKKVDLYLWVGRFPNGPSIKFLIENIHTSQEMKLTGNCLKGSRPVISFDADFKQVPHLKVIRELFTHVFNVPKMHPKSKPVIDHCYSFVNSDNKIWFRNYQIVYELQQKQLLNHELYEIGPRFVMNPIIMLDGCMMGIALFKNNEYTSRAKINANKKRERRQLMWDKESKKVKMENVLNTEIDHDIADEIFDEDDYDDQE